MFEFLFKYPSAVFSRGEFVLLGRWPVWLLAVLVLAAGAALAWHVRAHRGRLTGLRPAFVWLMQTALVALVLFLLWHPALSVATLKPQQNVVAVLVDDSRSMALKDGAAARLEQASAVLNSGLLDSLGKRFQVRLYRFGSQAQRIKTLAEVTGAAPASRIGDSLKQVLAESATLPLGAIVVLSDGADNSGGIDLDTISEIRRQRIPVHTIGFGQERPERDMEIADVTVPVRALADSRLTAAVSFRQFGYSGKKARISVKESGKVLATQEATLKSDGTLQTENLMFNAGPAGPRNLQVAVEPLEGETNRENNSVARLVNVEGAKPRILYIEGEPRWEFKFIRRAIDDDRSLQLVSMLRTTQNKIYRQGISNPKELEDGFPAKAEELFAYQGLIIGDVAAGYFTAAQQEMIREFANRRGGGVLFLGGRETLAEGGYAKSPLEEMLPLRLPSDKGTFRRDQANAELTPQGRDTVICRLDENPQKNAERWKKMPLLADYQLMGEAKPGAVVLLDMNAGSRRSPLLAVQNYGRGRTAVFATSGSWRWKMLQDHADQTHPAFWQQLLRFLVAGTPGQVVASTAHAVLNDETNVQFRVEARDKSFQAVPNARVEAHIVGPQGVTGDVELSPKPLEEGVYTAEWNAEKSGSYLAEIVVKRDNEEVGRDVVMFRRDDGVAENFHTAQNRELLAKLSDQTGGRYYTAQNARKLGEDISYSEAGITTREFRDLWDMPVIFLLALGLRSGEWLLRRRWGVV